jgi:hypothetical protein
VSRLLSSLSQVDTVEGIDEIHQLLLLDHCRPLDERHPNTPPLPDRSPSAEGAQLAHRHLQTVAAELKTYLKVGSEVTWLSMP